MKHILILFTIFSISACSSFRNDSDVVEERNIFTDFEILTNQICTDDLYKGVLSYLVVCHSLTQKYLIQSNIRTLSNEELDNFKNNILNAIKLSDQSLINTKKIFHLRLL